MIADRENLVNLVAGKKYATLRSGEDTNKNRKVTLIQPNDKRSKMRVLRFFIIILFLGSCGKDTNNVTGFKDNCEYTEKRYSRFSQSHKMSDSLNMRIDSLLYDHFKLLICYRKTIIGKKYLQKYTTITDSIGGYTVLSKDNLDILVFKRYSPKSEMVFLLFDNKLLKELDKIEIRFWGIGAEKKLFRNQDVFLPSSEGCINVETFDPIYPQ